MPDEPAPAQGADKGAPQGGTSTTDKSQGDDKQQKQEPQGASAEQLEALSRKVADLEKDNKKYRDAQRQADADKAAAADAEKTAAERLADMEKKLSDADERTRRTATRAAFTTEAVAAKAVYPEDVARLIDESKIEYDDDGNPTNVKALVAALKKDRPALFNARAGSFDGGARKTAPGPTDMNERIRRAAGRT